jgi:phytoene dehydrogenase-like protein
VVQVIFETEWQHWKDLRNDPQAYSDEKERVAAEVMDRLEHRYPGISGRVELTDVATPFTTWRYTLNHEGAYMGWLPTPDVLTTMVRRTLPGLDNFIMAGQWVVPGGGVPGCLYSGRHVAQILCHRDGKPFVTSVP